MVERGELLVATRQRAVRERRDLDCQRREQREVLIVVWRESSMQLGGA